jgi:hypothetical protein
MQLPALPALAPGASIVFDESDFNPPGPPPNELLRTKFSLNGDEGDDVWLVAGDPTLGLSGIVDHVDFGAAVSGESFGRDPHAPGQMIPLASVTLGAPNSAPRVGQVLITEVNYNPGPPSAAALAADPDITSDDLEFVEISNAAGAAKDLGGWRIRGGVDFNFEAGTVLAAGGTIVVLPFDPSAATNAGRLSAFRAHYGDALAANVVFVGGYANRLHNDLDNIILQRPGVPPADDPELIPYVSEDLVIYDDVAPWPTSADGTGSTLQRQTLGAGTDSASWLASAPTPGVGNLGHPVGDFNNDGTIDADDIDVLFAAINDGNDLRFDVDGSGALDNDDVTFLVETILGLSMGDANLDGRVDSADLNRVGINWQAQAGVGWADGDFTGDGKVNSADLNFIGLNWQAGVPAPAARPPRAPLTARQHARVRHETTDGHDLDVPGEPSIVPQPGRTWRIFRRK